MFPGYEVVVGRVSALYLTLCGTGDEFTNHVELAPVYLARMIRIVLLVAFVGANEIRHMHFPSDYCHLIRTRHHGRSRMYSHRGYTGTLGTFQRHAISTMRSNRLEQDIPGLEGFVQVRRLRLEELHCSIALKCGVTDTGNECS